jgi:hypothetical protein
VAKAKPPIVGRRLRADCKRGILFKEGAKYQRVRQARPIKSRLWRFSHLKI